MTDSQEPHTSRADLNGMRSDYLDRVREAFEKAIDLVSDFRELAQRHPDDAELWGLTRMLCAVIRQLLNTVTVKIAANGMAADWDRLFGEGCEKKPGGGAG